MMRPFKRQRTFSARSVMPGFAFQPRGLAAQPGLRSGIGEVKSLDVGYATAAATGGGIPLVLNSTGTIIPLNLITAGSSFFNRVGRKIEMKSVEFEFQPGVLTLSIASPVDQGRILIVYDRQTNGAIPALADVIQDTDSAGTNTSNALAGLNLNNRDRFLIIMDKRIELPQVTNTAGVVTNVWPNSFGGAEDGDGGAGVGVVHAYRKLKGLVTHFKADSAPAAIGDIATGGLFVLTLGINAVTTGASFNIPYWKSRLRYVDV